MSRSFVHTTISSLAQMLLLISSVLLLGPCLLQNKMIVQWLQYLSQVHLWAIVIHGLFYCILIILWPILVNYRISQNPWSQSQLNTAINMRWYLLAVFLLFDALMLWSH